MKDIPVVLVILVAGIFIFIRLADKPPVQLKRYNPVRVTMQGGCPQSIEAADGVRNPNSDELDERMVPMNPIKVRVCRYGPTSNGSGSNDARLKTSAAAGRLEAVRLADNLNNIDDPHVEGELLTCPLDVGKTVDVLVFAFAARSEVDVWFARTGCQSVDNGYAIRAYRKQPTIAQFNRFSKYLDDVVIAHKVK